CATLEEVHSQGQTEKRCFVEMLSWIGPRRLWRGVIGSLVFCLAFYPATILTRHVAAQGKTPSSITAHVEAGEFGPARAAAEALPAADRDEALASIAAAQSRAGARNASFTPAYDIRSDVARRDTFQQIRSQGPSGSYSGGYSGGTGGFGSGSAPGGMPRGGGVIAD